MSEAKMRMAGNQLRVAARLMETAGTGRALYNMATKQLGLQRIKTVEIPGHVPLYLPEHLLAQTPREDER